MRTIVDGVDWMAESFATFMSRVSGVTVEVRMFTTAAASVDSFTESG